MVNKEVKMQTLDKEILKQKNSNIPFTKQEAIDYLMSTLDESDKEFISYTIESDVPELLLSWGEKILKEFCLYDGNTHLIQDCCKENPSPTNAAYEIVKGVWLNCQAKK